MKSKWKEYIINVYLHAGMCAWGRKEAADHLWAQVNHMARNSYLSCTTNEIFNAACVENVVKVTCCAVTR
eukprot:scaffold227111_cov17-Prasinocladus_malaysianus.AAC.2